MKWELCQLKTTSRRVVDPKTTDLIYYAGLLQNIGKITLPEKLFPFFDGLIPEGWLLNIAERSWKINQRDRMSLLLACCKDCIGAVSVVPEEENI